MLMKKLLVPIDYSDCSVNALDYAANLAKNFNASVHVLHVFRLPSAGGTPIIWDMEVTLQKERENEMNATLRAFKEKYADVKFTSSVTLGLASHVIIESLEEGDYDLLVMGTTGATGLKEMFIGSTTASLIDKVNTPLFVVPESSKYENIESFILTSDLDRIIEESKLEIVKNLASSYNACIKVLSVKDKLDHFDYEEDVKSLEVLIELESDLADTDYTTEIIEKTDFADLEDAMFDYSNESNSVLVLIHRKRSFFKRIFGQSYSKKFAMHATNPILILQD